MKKIIKKTTKRTITSTESNTRPVVSHEHKVVTDEYNSGYDNERNDYRSTKHKVNDDASSRITSEGNTHRAVLPEESEERNDD